MEIILDEIHNYGQSRLFLTAEYSEISDSREKSTLFNFYVRREKYCKSSSTGHTKRLSKKESNVFIEVPVFSLYRKEIMYLISGWAARVEPIDRPFADSVKEVIYCFYHKVLKVAERVGVSSGLMVITARLSINETIREEEPVESCAICLENFDSDSDIYETRCQHSFHRKCILEWRKHKETCPLCRFRI